MTEDEVKEIMQRARERELNRYMELTPEELNLRIIRKRCGDCDNWNKSSMCPKEHNVRGFSRGPSMGAHPCNEFTPDFAFGIALEVQAMNKLKS